MKFNIRKLKLLSIIGLSQVNGMQEKGIENIPINKEILKETNNQEINNNSQNGQLSHEQRMKEHEKAHKQIMKAHEKEHQETMKNNVQTVRTQLEKLKKAVKATDAVYKSQIEALETLVVTLENNLKNKNLNRTYQ